VVRPRSVAIRSVMCTGVATGRFDALSHQFLHKNAASRSHG